MNRSGTIYYYYFCVFLFYRSEAINKTFEAVVPDAQCNNATGGDTSGGDTAVVVEIQY